MKNIKTSVIIPTSKNEKIENINRTIKSVILGAFDEIEVLVLADGWIPEGIYKKAKVSSSSLNLGERKTVNRGFKESSGDYVLRIDAHCSMSRFWDRFLLKQYEDDTVSLCVLDALDEETWEPKNRSFAFVYVDNDCKEKWWTNYKQSFCRCEPSMSLTGCGWFCNRQFFLDNLQFDEDLSKWGAIGPEITAKIERAGSSIILNKNVRCNHVFNTAKPGYPVKEVDRTREQLLERYSQFLYKAAKRFNAPGWGFSETK